MIRPDHPAFAPGPSERVPAVRGAGSTTGAHRGGLRGLWDRVRARPAQPAGQPRSPNDDEPDDAALVQRVAQGDAQAFDALYHRYARRLGGYLWKLLRRPELVEEVLDDVLLVVWQKAADFDPARRFSTWAFGIAHFKALKALERLQRERAWPAPGAADGPDDAGEAGDVESAESPEQILMREDLRESVRRALQALSPDHRAVLELTFYEGFSYPEIAAIVGCPVNTVKTRTFHARKRLAIALAEGERGKGFQPREAQS